MGQALVVGMAVGSVVSATIGTTQSATNLCNTQSNQLANIADYTTRMGKLLSQLEAGVQVEYEQLQELNRSIEKIKEQRKEAQTQYKFYFLLLNAVLGLLLLVIAVLLYLKHYKVLSLDPLKK